MLGATGADGQRQSCVPHAQEGGSQSADGGNRQETPPDAPAEAESWPYQVSSWLIREETRMCRRFLADTATG